MKQQKKMSLIAWLMLASEVLLLLFVAEWLRMQYRKQEGELHHDIQAIFVNTYDQMNDVVLDSMVNRVLKEKRDSGKAHISVRYATDQATMITIDDRDRPTPVPSLKSYEFTSQDTMRQSDSDSGLFFFPQVRIRHTSDTARLPEQVTKALRIAVRRTANIPELYNKGFTLHPDSNALKHNFDAALRKKALPFPTHWTGLVTPADSLFYYYPDHMPGAAALAVDGYQPYLLKALLPQMLFSAILLLLTGLAFLLAYRNMKQQRRFSEQKDNFISNISHELKTPVATTKVALEALSKYNALEDPQRSAKYLRMATWEMERLETMINRVMNTIQAEQGYMSLQRERLDLSALLQEIMDMLQPLLREKGIEAAWDRPPQPVFIWADKAHLQGTLYNLLDNAAKYGGNRIGIALSATAGQVLLNIADNGGGIAKEYHKKVFERFFRIPSEKGHQVKGHGLGLSYAQHIVQAHGGSIYIGDTPGGGATFTISLPETPHDAS